MHILWSKFTDSLWCIGCVDRNVKQTASLRVPEFQYGKEIMLSQMMMYLYNVLVGGMERLKRLDVWEFKNLLILKRNNVVPDDDVCI